MIVSEREVQTLGLGGWSQYQAESPEFLQSCHALNCSCIEAKTFSHAVQKISTIRFWKVLQAARQNETVVGLQYIQSIHWENYILW